MLKIKPLHVFAQAMGVWNSVTHHLSLRNYFEGPRISLHVYPQNLSRNDTDIGCFLGTSGLVGMLTPKGPGNPKRVFAISGSLDEGVKSNIFV